MNKALLPVALLVLFLSGCGPSDEKLQGRPAVLQLGMKISTAATEQELNAAQARIATLGQNAKVQEHLNKAVEEQRKLLSAAAEMQMNERMQGAQKVLAELEAASNAVE